MATGFSYGDGKLTVMNLAAPGIAVPNGGAIVDAINRTGGNTGKALIRDLRGSYSDDGSGNPNWSDNVSSTVGTWGPTGGSGVSYLELMHRKFTAEPTTTPERCYGDSDLSVNVNTYWSVLLVIECYLYYTGTPAAPAAGTYMDIYPGTTAFRLQITDADLVDQGPTDAWYFARKTYNFNRLPGFAGNFHCAADSIVTLDASGTNDVYTKVDMRFWFNLHYAGRYRMNSGGV